MQIWLCALMDRTKKWLLDLNCAVILEVLCLCVHLRRTLRSFVSCFFFYLSTVWSIYTKTGIKDGICWVLFAFCKLSAWSSAVSTMSKDATATYDSSLLRQIKFCLLSIMRQSSHSSNWTSNRLNGIYHQSALYRSSTILMKSYYKLAMFHRSSSSSCEKY